MAIFSLNHKSIGRTTHAPGTAAAHIAYITRRSAASAVLSARMPIARPGRSGDVRAWINTQEASDRKNGRVADKIMVALPQELSAEQAEALVHRFAEAITRGRAPWIAGMHLEPGNPHVHILIRDKDVETGKRVAQLSEQGSTERIRVTWQRYANEALEMAGSDARIDHRSLAAQSIDRIPQIHVGPRAKAMEARGVIPVSEDRFDPRRPEREIRWTEIDNGLTRAEYNAQIITSNAEAERRRQEEAARAEAERQRRESAAQAEQLRKEEAKAKTQRLLDEADERLRQIRAARAEGDLQRQLDAEAQQRRLEAAYAARREADARRRLTVSGPTVQLPPATAPADVPQKRVDAPITASAPAPVRAPRPAADPVAPPRGLEAPRAAVQASKPAAAPVTPSEAAPAARQAPQPAATPTGEATAEADRRRETEIRELSKTARPGSIFLGAALQRAKNYIPADQLRAEGRKISDIFRTEGDRAGARIIELVMDAISDVRASLPLLRFDPASVDMASLMRRLAKATPLIARFIVDRGDEGGHGGRGENGRGG